uniref:SCAN box domain-containing protein n=1 Tax=Oryzias latipes TaxID=8090 RepID=A0A3P9I8W2_ORYLA
MKRSQKNLHSTTAVSSIERTSPGEMRTACAEMDRGRTNVYRAVHGVCRERRNISPVTCCRRLRSAEVPSRRGPAGACCRLKGLCRGWDRPERCTEEQSGSIVAMGPQLQVQPSGVRTWVEEHEPEDGPADAWCVKFRRSRTIWCFKYW